MFLIAATLTASAAITTSSSFAFSAKKKREKKSHFTLVKFELFLTLLTMMLVALLSLHLTSCNAYSGNDPNTSSNMIAVILWNMPNLFFFVFLSLIPVKQYMCVCL